MKDVRESERCMLDDTGAAEWMWQRVGRYVARPGVLFRCA